MEDGRIQKRTALMKNSHRQTSQRDVTPNSLTPMNEKFAKSPRSCKKMVELIEKSQLYHLENEQRF